MFFYEFLNSFFRKACQNPARYAKLKAFSFHSVKTEWKLHFEFKSYDHFVRQTNFPDFYWRQQGHDCGIWNFVSCPFSLPSFIIMAFLKLRLEGRRQYDPSPEETRDYQRLGKMELRRYWIIKSFFLMLSLFVRNQYNIQSTKVSYFNNSAMRTQLWDLNSYGTFNFQPLPFFNLNSQIHHRTTDFSHKFYDKLSISLKLKYSLVPTRSCTQILQIYQEKGKNLWLP